MDSKKEDNGVTGSIGGDGTDQDLDGGDFGGVVPRADFHHDDVHELQQSNRKEETDNLVTKIISTIKDGKAFRASKKGIHASKKGFHASKK